MTVNDVCVRLLPADLTLRGETLDLAADHLTITAVLSTDSRVSNVRPIGAPYS